MKYFCLLALLVILTVTACNKTQNPNPNLVTILETGTWHLSSGTFSMKLPNGKDTTLNYVGLVIDTNCHKDDYLKFYSGFSGAVYSGSDKCNASDPDSVGFSWYLSNNNNTVSIYNSQNFYFSVFETVVQPYFFDTISHTPLELDSFYYAGGPSKVDTMYNLSFTEIPAAPTPPSTSLVDINNATITNLSQSSFTLNFAVYGSSYVYPDSTIFHQMDPIYRADTFHYSLTYTNN